MRSSRDDLLEDAETLQFLGASAIKKLEKHVRSLKNDTKSYESRIAVLLTSSAEQLLSEFSGAVTRILQIKKELEHASTGDIHKIRDTKKMCASMIRVLYSRLGTTLAEGNWQSPSFASALSSEAGSETGTIYPSQDDYKRDAYAAEREYAQRYVSEYVDHAILRSVTALNTSSGMSAFATVVEAVRGEFPTHGSVLAGSESYFQNKWVLENKFGNSVQYADELNADNFLQHANELQPDLICLDSFSSAKAALPNVSKILRTLPQIVKHPFSLVLDNTVLSTSYQPLTDVPRNSTMQIYVIESLLKYHQFGLDRVNAGIIWSLSNHASRMSAARMHLGAIIPEASLHSLPEPNRVLFDARLKRIGDNAELLARRLHAFAKDNGTFVESVAHPSLHVKKTDSQSFFRGPFVVLRFKQEYDSVKKYDQFVARVIGKAREKGVGLVGGTSFGFDVTRIYVAARLAEGLSKPYLRISVGTETVDEISALADVFEQVLR